MNTGSGQASIQETFHGTFDLRDVDSPRERWEIDRELGSGRYAEPFVLYRHLDYYRKRIEKWGGKPPETTGDILRPSVREDGKEPDWYEVGGYLVFDSKTQGYPYHYAVLAVGMLLESSFPRHALVRGDITRRQAEQTAEWVTAVLGRRVPLPLIVDGPRRWKRMTEAYPASGPLDTTIQRFRTLLVGDDEATLRVLDEVRADPQAVRRVYLQELDHYRSLNQHGARALIRAVCNVDGAWRGRSTGPAVRERPLRSKTPTRNRRQADSGRLVPG